MQILTYVWPKPTWLNGMEQTEAGEIIFEIRPGASAYVLLEQSQILFQISHRTDRTDFFFFFQTNQIHLLFQNSINRVLRNSIPRATIWVLASVSQELLPNSNICRTIGLECPLQFRAGETTVCDLSSCQEWVLLVTGTHDKCSRRLT